MNFSVYTNCEKIHPKHGVRVAPLYSKKDAQVMHITLQPGEKLIPHKTPVDVFFYVLEGTVQVSIGEEEHPFSRDTLIESPAHIRHFLSNHEDVPCRVLVVKTPNPTV
ncbi:MAG: cupin domain-containing protein [Fibrobacterota bacterium]